MQPDNHANYGTSTVGSSFFLYFNFIYNFGLNYHQCTSKVGIAVWNNINFLGLFI